MHPIKLFWAARAVINKPFFGHIGLPAYIGRPCFIEGRKRITVGSRTRIFPGIRMEAIGNGSIEIGGNCAMEQNVHLISGDGILKIGEGTTISANVFISNVDHDYRDVTKSVMEQPLLYKKTEIGPGCFIGFGATLLPGTILGKHCIVGSNAVVKGTYPDYSVIAGVPARVVRSFNEQNGQWERENHG